MKMNQLVMTVLLLATVFFGTPEGVCSDSWITDRDLQRRVADIGSRLATTRSVEDNQALAGDIQNIAHEISQQIGLAESPDWLTPSAARRAVIEQAANLLQPYDILLVGMAFDETRSGSSAVSRQCLSLLDYAKPDAQLRQVLEQQARTNYEAGLEPFRLLFEHRLLDEPLRELVKTRIEGETNIQNKLKMSLASAEMGFEEVLPVCEQRRVFESMTSGAV